MGVSSLSADLSAPHAALWTGNGSTDLHPIALLGAADLSSGSAALGLTGDLQVGWGYGPKTQGRTLALAWRDTAASVVALAAPFANPFSSQAAGTDGAQIVGSAVGFEKDGSVSTIPHAVLWNPTTGAATDLGNAGNNGAVALAVSRGQQVGYTFRSKGTTQLATLWNGTAKSQVVIHPSNATISEALATDGVHQAGFIAFDLRVGESGTKNFATRRFYSPEVWSGSDRSGHTIPPYPFDNGLALGVNGPSVVGYVYNGTGAGTPATYHATIWDAAYQATDLNAFLPAGFTGAMATAIDAQGNIAGVIITADGRQHAAVWLPNR